MSVRRLAVSGFIVALVTLPGAVSAQEPPRAALEGLAGWAGFPDESIIHHLVVGAAARFHLKPRFSIGPELVYMIGPGHDRDLFVLGNVFFEFGPSTPERPAVVPFLVAGAGLFHGRNRFGRQIETHNSGTAAVGGGIRLAVSRRVYMAPDVRLAVEAHIRATVSVGVHLGE